MNNTEHCIPNFKEMNDESYDAANRISNLDCKSPIEYEGVDKVLKLMVAASRL
jgi:hypothetical protein